MNKKYILYLLLFIFISIFFTKLFNTLKENDIRVFAKQNLHETNTAYKSILDTYKNAARKDFFYLMKKKEVIKILKEFKDNKEEEKRAILRGKLYRLLYKNYEELKNFNIRQFHFHTSNGKSLLRFHSPSENGDSLINFRQSIKIANIKLQSSSGFEAGRLYPGFRYVFPIIHKKEHLGSVEFSLSFEGIEKKLKNILINNQYTLLLDENTSVNKVFSWHKIFFRKSTISKYYYVENENISKINKTINENKEIKELNKLISKNKIFLDSHNKKENFAFNIINKKNSYIISFLAIKDINGKFSGYLVSYSKTKEIFEIIDKYKLFISLSYLVLVLVAILLVFLIEERKKTLKKQEELFIVNNNLQDILDHQNNIIILNKEGYIYQANRQFLEVTGFDSLELFKEKYRCICDKFIKDENNKELLHKDIFMSSLINKKFQLVNNKMAKIYNEKTKEIETYLVTVDNFNRDLEFIIILTNITELIELQEVVSEQNRITSVADMLGNIAHQWRQPLSIITVSASGLKLSNELGLNDKEQISTSMDKIVEHSQYLSDTINNFKNFFDESSKDNKLTNLKNVIHEVENATHKEFKENHISTISDLEEIEIISNKNNLIQAIKNIYINVIDAYNMHKIETNERYFFVSLKKIDNHIIFSFKDAALGIRIKKLEKIFEPYFTTKHEAIGTGISLYMTHQIITKQLKGSIQVKNVSYEYNGKNIKGAEFILKLAIN